MSRIIRFTILCNQDERQMIASLAVRLQRTQSDMMRLLVVNAARELELIDSRITKISASALPKEERTNVNSSTRN